MIFFPLHPNVRYSYLGLFMNKDLLNKELKETDGEKIKSDGPSVCGEHQRMEWFTASEAAGCGDLPSSERWAREHLAKLAEGREHLKRRRKGTKATEYHISLFSSNTQMTPREEPAENTYQQENKLVTPIDRELLQTCIEAIELLCEKKRLRMSPEKKAKVIALVYTISLEEKNVDESVVYQILDLAS